MRVISITEIERQAATPPGTVIVGTQGPPGPQGPQGIQGPPGAPGISAGRELLTAARTYYVRADGSDANTGLVDSAGGAFLTVQRAIDVAAALDLGIYNVTIRIGDGTYAGAIRPKSLVGAGVVVITGNTTAPSNVTINPGAADIIYGDSIRGAYIFRGMRLLCSGGGSAIRAVGNPTYFRFSSIDFGAAGNAHINTQFGGRIDAEGNYTISGGAVFHVVCDGGISWLGSRTVTLIGTPAFSGAFVLAQKGSGVIDAVAMTFSGPATGVRYVAQYLGQILTAGGGASYFPGSAPGSGTNPGASPHGLYT